MKMQVKLLSVVIVALFLASLTGCGSVQKLRRADELEIENQRLQDNLAILERKMKNALEEKDLEISKLRRQKERELEKVKTEMKGEVDNLESAKHQLERTLKGELENYKAKLTMTERGLIVTFLAEVLFDSGKDVVKPEGYSVLNSVAEVLKKEASTSDVAIEGHTDNEPIKYSGWKSNWELSAHRALSVLHYFIEKEAVASERLSAVGYGEYRTVASNDTSEGKQKNRRVEIVILPGKMEKAR